MITYRTNFDGYYHWRGPWLRYIYIKDNPVDGKEIESINELGPEIDANEATDVTEGCITSINVNVVQSLLRINNNLYLFDHIEWKQHDEYDGTELKSGSTDSTSLNIDNHDRTFDDGPVDVYVYYKTPSNYITITAEPITSDKKPNYDAGSVNPASQSAVPGYEIQSITATAESGYRFVKWQTTAGQQLTTSTTLTIYSAPSVATKYQALFERQKCSVTASCSPSTYGNIIGLKSEYYVGDTISLTATANSGYRFKNWSYSQSGIAAQTSTSSTLSFELTKTSASITAYFEKIPTYTLTTQCNPSNGGSISGNQSPYQEGATAELTATANSGYKFKSWQYGSASNPTKSSTNNPLSFEITENSKAIAQFEARPFVTVNYTPMIQVSVSGAGYYDKGSEATLIVSLSDDTYYFEGWTKDSGSEILSTSLSYTVTVTANVRYVAHFKKKMSVTGIPVENGRITGGGLYIPGSTVTLTAHPNTNYYLTGWEFPEYIAEHGNIQYDDDDPNVVTFDLVRDDDDTTEISISGYFDLKPKVTVTIAPTGEHGPPGEVNGLASGGYYLPQSQVALTATANEGYRFEKWLTPIDSEEHTSDSYSFTITEDISLTAQFKKLKHIEAETDPESTETIEGVGWYDVGEKVTLKAPTSVGAAHWSFAEWTSGTETISTSRSVEITVKDDQKFIAHYYDSTRPHIIAKYTINGYVGTEKLEITPTVIGKLYADNRITINVPYYVEKTVEGTKKIYRYSSYSYEFGGKPQSILVLGSPFLSEHSYESFQFNNYQMILEGDDTYERGDLTLNVNYEEIEHPIQITAHSEDVTKGSASPETQYVESGTSFTIRAVPEYGYSFSHWTTQNDDSGESPILTNPVYSGIAEEDVTYIAHFERDTVKYKVTVIANPTEGGIVTGGGEYIEGTTVILKALANPGYKFIKWSGPSGESTSKEWTIVVSTQNVTYTAAFKQTAIVEPVHKYRVLIANNSYTTSTNVELNCTLSTNKNQRATIIENGKAYTKIGEFDVDENCIVTISPDDTSSAPTQMFFYCASHKNPAAVLKDWRNSSNSGEFKLTEDIEVFGGYAWDYFLGRSLKTAHAYYTVTPTGLFTNDTHIHALEKYKIEGRGGTGYNAFAGIAAENLVDRLKTPLENLAVQDIETYGSLNKWIERNPSTICLPTDIEIEKWFYDYRQKGTDEQNYLKYGISNPSYRHQIQNVNASLYCLDTQTTVSTPSFLPYSLDSGNPLKLNAPESFVADDESKTEYVFYKFVYSSDHDPISPTIENGAHIEFPNKTTTTSLNPTPFYGTLTIQAQYIPKDTLCTITTCVDETDNAGTTSPETQMIPIGLGPEYSSFTITATPNANAEFYFWTCSSNTESTTAKSTNATLTQELTDKTKTQMTYTAHFGSSNSHYLSTSVFSGKGTTSGDGLYAEGSSVEITAIPENGYHFVKWISDSEEYSSSTQNISMGYNDVEYKAVFENDSDGTGQFSIESHVVTYDGHQKIIGDGRHSVSTATLSISSHENWFPCKIMILGSENDAIWKFNTQPENPYPVTILASADQNVRVYVWMCPIPTGELVYDETTNKLIFGSTNAPIYL